MNEECSKSHHKGKADEDIPDLVQLRELSLELGGLLHETFEAVKGVLGHQSFTEWCQFNVWAVGCGRAGDQWCFHFELKIASMDVFEAVFFNGLPF